MSLFSHALETIHAPGGIVGPIPLRGPSGQLLNIGLHQSEAISWLPVDKRALDVEIRARVVAWNPVPAFPVNTQEPLVRFQIEIGHGSAVWTEPIRSWVGSQGRPTIEPWLIPARGLILRVTARELRMSATYLGTPSQPDHAYPVITLQVSFQPVGGVDCPVYPRQDFDVPELGGGHAQVFPVGAQEWRLFDAIGDPFPPGLHLDVSLLGIAGTLRTDLDRAAYAQWRPITSSMAAWTTTLLLGPDQDAPVMAYAEYR